MVSTRRDALKIFGFGGALVVAAPALLSGARAHAETAANLFAGKLGPFVQINADNSVTIGAPVRDMGTGVETALPMIVAEELDVDWVQVKVERMPYAVRADAEGNFQDLYVSQGTGGSYAVRFAWKPLRDCGALARDLIVKAAAAEWGVAHSAIETAGGHVTNKQTGLKKPYADFVGAAVKLEMPDVSVDWVGSVRRYEVQVPAENAGGPRRKARSEYSIVGKPTGQENARRVVTGTEPFGIDIDIDGQQHAVIERCPYFDGDVKSYSAEAALAVPGVTAVVQVPSLAGEGANYKFNAPGVAVVASSLWAAMRGRSLLEIEWDMGPNTHENNVWQMQVAAEAIEKKQPDVLFEQGDFDASFVGAKKKIEAVYTNPPFAHMNMEPMNCAASIEADKCIIATSHQNPGGAAAYAVGFTGLPIEKIEVRAGRIGCGFGRKWANDFVAEALFLSREVKTPVKVFWTREDDVQHDNFNDSGYALMQAGLDENNNLVAWHSCYSAGSGTRMRGFPTHLVPNIRVERVRCEERRLALGPWRGPGNNTSGFYISSFMDEVAHEMKRDPLELWLSLLGEDRDLPFGEWLPDPRGQGLSTTKTKAVLKLAADKAAWGEKLPEGWGRGIAAHMTHGGYAAFVVDVSYSSETGLVVERVFGAAECGMIVNPLGAAAQMESGVIDGLSTVLYQNVQIEGGRIISDNFDAMPLLRIAEAPKHFEMHFVDSKDEPWGTGEMALPAFIPALMNAIFDATGRRIRNLPLGDQLSA